MFLDLKSIDFRITSKMEPRKIEISAYALQKSQSILQYKKA